MCSHTLKHHQPCNFDPVALTEIENKPTLIFITHSGLALQIKHILLLITPARLLASLSVPFKAAFIDS